MPQYLKEKSLGSTLTVIDGISGSGKLLLAELTKAITNSECWQHEYLFDSIPIVHGEGKIDESTASMLLKTSFDMLSYNLMIGRNINLRVSDQSCVFKSPKAATYIRRLLSKPVDKQVLKDRCREINIPIIVHHSSFNNYLLESAFGKQLRLAYVLRNPVYCLEHWISSVERIGEDPRDFTIYSRSSHEAVPWYINEGDNLYCEGGVLEKTIATIHSLSKILYNKLLNIDCKAYFIADFDDLVRDPYKSATHLRQFIGHGEIDITSFRRMCKRNRIPREAISPIRGYWKHYCSSAEYDKRLKSEETALEFYLSQTSQEGSDRLKESIEIYKYIKNSAGI